MLLAEFHRGPFDGERMVLPTEEPWPRFVIPKFGTIIIQYFYLYAGEDDDLYLYLFDEDFGSVTGA